MATTRTPRATAPGRERGRRPFRPPLAAATAAVVVSVVVVVLLWWSIWFFDGTLATSGALLVIGRLAEVAAAVAGLSVPVAAVLGLRAAFRSASFAKAGNIPDARVAADDVRQWRWYVVGFGTTALIVSFLFWFFGSSGGRVRTVLFNWHYPRAHLGDLAAGFWINVKISVVAEIIVLAWALFVAVVRLVPGRAGTPLRWLAIAYTDLFRGIPALLVIYIVVFGFPLAHVPLFTSLGRSSQLFWLAVLGLTLTYGAYVSEVYRAGLESIHWSQTAAARSLGLVTRPDAPLRRRPPGGQAHHPSAPERLHRAPEGHRAGVDRRRAGDREPRHDLEGHLLQPVVHHRCGRVLPRRHDPADPPHRLPDQARPVPDAGQRLSMDPFLVIDQVHKQFGTNHVLTGVDLSVEEHQVVCLIGPSGCGKSTLLRCINGLEPIQGGEIRLEGERVSGRGVDLNWLHREVGIVFQSFNLFPHMTVLENVTLGPLKVLRYPKAYSHVQAMTLLERVGLADKAQEYPDRLSGGQQQRVAIVRALAMGPRLLLLDEITSALDPELVAEVLNIVRNLAEEGMTMMLATHEMGFAREVASKICFLDGGVVAEEGPPERIFSEPENPRTQTFLRRIIEARRL